MSETVLLDDTNRAQAEVLGLLQLQVEKKAQELAKLSNKERADARQQFNELTTEMMRAAGGIKRLSQFWMRQIRIAAKNNPGGKVALDGLKSFVRTWVDAKSTELDSIGDSSNFTDEELDDEIKLEFLKSVGSITEELMPLDTKTIAKRERIKQKRLANLKQNTIEPEDDRTSE